MPSVPYTEAALLSYCSVVPARFDSLVTDQVLARLPIRTLATQCEKRAIVTDADKPAIVYIGSGGTLNDTAVTWDAPSVLSSLRPRAQCPPAANDSSAFESVPARVGTTSDLTFAAGRLVASGGAIAPGMRPAHDASGSDVTRASVLAATGYDLSLGVPAPIPGLAWNAERYLYEPALDQAGLPFREPGKRGLYLQPYQDPSLGAGRAGLRWTQVDTLEPTPGRPYRPVGPTESAALWTGVQQYRGMIESNLLGRQMKGESSFRENPNAAPYVSPHVLPVKSPNERDFAWIQSSGLPAGMPYSGFPYTPVPMADFLSGAWLMPGYRPSVALPRGFESVQYIPVAPPSGPLKPK